MLRAYDANTNRAAEGLRVLEDVARFFFDHAELSSRLKHLRHSLRQHSPVGALADRRAASDVGIGCVAVGEQERRTLADVVHANAKRAQEALRVLEELGKLQHIDSTPCATIRYALYDIERALIACIPATRLAQAYVYVLIDSSLCADPLAMAQAAQAGGADIIQLRAKNMNQRAYIACAQAMRSVLDTSLFIVNDDVAVAKIVAADGVHLGQDDMSVADARAVLGPLAIIGLSTHSAEQIAAARTQAIDYIGMGPVYATTTKPHEPCRGVAVLDAVHELAGTLPSYAIGGMTHARIQALGARIPHGVAVAGAVCSSENPQQACADLCELFADRAAASQAVLQEES